MRTVEPWAISEDTTTVIKSRRNQENTNAAEIVYSPAWERVKAIADSIKNKYVAPLAGEKYELYSIVRDVLDELIGTIEHDAGMAPAITGEE